MRIVETKVAEKIETRILCSNFFPLYEIMCKSIEEPDRPEVTIYRV